MCWQPDALPSAEFRFSRATPDVMFRLLYLSPFAVLHRCRRHRCLLSLASFISQRALHRTILMFVFHWCVSVLCTRKIKDTQCGESRQPAFVFLVFSFSPCFCWSVFFSSSRTPSSGSVAARRRLARRHSEPWLGRTESFFFVMTCLSSFTVVHSYAESLRSFVENTANSVCRPQDSSCSPETRPLWCSGPCTYSDGRSTSR